jgi:hypothetical protein
MSFRSIPLYVPLPPAGGTAWVRVPTAGLGGAMTVADVLCFNGAATSSTISIYVDVLAGTGATTQNYFTKSSTTWTYSSWYPFPNS